MVERKSSGNAVHMGFVVLRMGEVAVARIAKEGQLLLEDRESNHVLSSVFVVEVEKVDLRNHQWGSGRVGHMLELEIVLDLNWQLQPTDSKRRLAVVGSFRGVL